MEEKLEEIKELLKETLLNSKKDFELLTAQDVAAEFNIGLNTVRKMFADSKLQVQRYTVPHVVMRKSLLQYFTESHDYIKK